LWRHLTHGFRALSHPAAAEKDLAEEVDHYFEEAVADFEASGLSREEARRAARRALGNAAGVREQVRSYGWEHVLETVGADVRYGFRRLNADRGFALVSIITLALGIGASTAIFSAVNPILFQPLPYPHPDRVVTFWDLARDGSRLDITFGNYREVTDRSRSFEALAVMKPWQPTLTGAAEAERLEGQRTSASYFRALGVLPSIGRNFEPSDDRVNGPNVAIISDSLWRRRFGGDRQIIGSDITLDDDLFTVIGVLPATFENLPRPAAEIWAPLQYDASLPAQGREWGRHLRMIGRLRAGMDIKVVEQELGAIAGAEVPEYRRQPWARMGRGLLVRALQDDVTESVRPALLAVLGAVLLVLALACVNVSSLLLGRGTRRRGEFAMRAALGAERGRLVRQLVTESILLAVLGGVMGIGVARASVTLLLALSPAALPRADAISLDLQALVFALLITAVVGVAAGIVPARQASRGNLQHTLVRSRRTAAGGHRLARRALVIVEVALALVLLVGAGLLLRSLQHLFAISPGFNSGHVLTMQVQASGRRFDRDGTQRFFTRALEAAQRVPGVEAAAFSSQLPLSGDREEYGVRVESSVAQTTEAGLPAFRYAVTASYFEALELPLRRGRLLDARDAAAAPRSALVSESLAGKFPGGDPIGKRIRIGQSDGPPFEVVGVVGNVRQMSLAIGEADAVYVTPEQWHFADTALWLVVRTRGAASTLAPALRAAIWAVDKDQPIVRVSTLDALVEATAAERRFALILFEAFGLVALTLAAIGIYGLLSGTVNERTREIGIRSALGASRREIVAMVVRQAMSLTLIGIAAGITAAVVASQGLVTLLFGVTHLDVSTYAGVVGLLIFTSCVACVVPAWRAAWVDPTIALKLE
jgi:putative ABC transport system permease protein